MNKMELTRRSFFGRSIAAIAGLITLGLAVPIAGYIALPAFRQRRDYWSEVGPLNDLQINSPKELDVVQSVSSGWMKTETTRSVWAFRKPNGEIVVYSPICPHLGCGYHWDDEKKEFLCPCHGSIFDLDGKVLGGPAPRSLDTLPAKGEGDRLFVLYEQFKVGISKKEEI